MFAKVMIVSVIAMAIMQIAPSLGLFALIGGGIFVAVWDGKDKKAQNTAKYGYDPVRQNYKDLPAEQKKRVDDIRHEGYITKDQEIVQICRNQQAIPGTMMQRLNGEPQYYPSLKQFEEYGSTLSRSLDDKLMSAAEYESREWTKKRNVFIQEDNWQSARNNLINIMNECVAFENRGSLPAKTEVKEEPKKIEPRKPYTAINDDIFD